MSNETVELPELIVPDKEVVPKLETTAEKRSIEQSDPYAIKKARYQKKPKNSLRYDDKGHLPEFDNKQSATRCKNESCSSRTHIFCIKCGVHLCTTKGRSCFKEFHTLNDTESD